MYWRCCGTGTASKVVVLDVNHCYESYDTEFTVTWINHMVAHPVYRSPVINVQKITLELNCYKY